MEIKNNKITILLLCLILTSTQNSTQILNITQVPKDKKDRHACRLEHHGVNSSSKSNVELLHCIAYGIFDDEKCIYVGITYQTLSRRIREHRTNCYNKKRHHYNCLIYKYIRGIEGGFDSLEFRILEKKICSLKEKSAIERHYYDIYNVNGNLKNKCVPNQSKKEYNTKHKDEINARCKEYKTKHKDEFNARRREYNTKHKDEINARRRSRYAENITEINARRRSRYAENKHLN